MRGLADENTVPAPLATPGGHAKLDPERSVKYPRRISQVNPIFGLILRAIGF
jgi:hypothetical protein